MLRLGSGGSDKQVCELCLCLEIRTDRCGVSLREAVSASHPHQPCPRPPFTCVCSPFLRESCPRWMRFRPHSPGSALRPGHQQAHRPPVCLPLHTPFLLHTVPTVLHAVPSPSHVLVCGLGLLGFPFIVRKLPCSSSAFVAEEPSSWLNLTVA